MVLRLTILILLIRNNGNDNIKFLNPILYILCARELIYGIKKVLHERDFLQVHNFIIFSIKLISINDIFNLNFFY